MRGRTGTGKNVFADLLKALLNEKQVYSTNSFTDITGQFNGAIANKILLIGEEALWGGNKKEMEALKDLITSDKLALRLKFREAIQYDNYIRFILLTNNDWIPAGKDERRIYCLDVSEREKGNSSYFANLNKIIKNDIDGFGAWLESIYNPDFDFQGNYRLTEGVKESLVYGADSVYDFAEDYIEYVDKYCVTECSFEDVYKMYFDMRSSKYKDSKKIFIKKLKMIFPRMKEDIRGKSRTKHFIDFNIPEMVEDYENYFSR